MQQQMADNEKEVILATVDDLPSWVRLESSHNYICILTFKWPPTCIIKDQIKITLELLHDIIKLNLAVFALILIHLLQYLTDS